jgi:predicted permease
MLSLLRQSFRRLLRQPAHALTVVLTLGIGIGLVATQYSLVDGVLLRPLPFDEGVRIMHVARDDARGGLGWWRVLGHDEYEALATDQRSFSELVAWRSETYNLVDAGGPPQRLWGSAVSGDFFAMLRVRPVLGRLLGRDDEGPGRPLRAMIAWSLWQDRFGADPAVVGRQVRLNGELAEIIGVLPQGFQFPSRERVWVNLRLETLPPPAENFGVEVGGRLADGVSPAMAAAELETLLRNRRLAAGLSADEHGAVVVQPVPRAYGAGNTVPVLYSMLAMTAFVLLLACINVGNLQAVQVIARAGELAVRGALGAGRRHLLRLLVADCLLLGAAGFAAGVGIAWIGIALIDAEATRRLQMAGWMHFDLDLRVLAVAAGLSVGAATLAGVFPVLAMLRGDTNALLRDGGRGQIGGGRGRVGRWFVAFQLAFACATLLVAALLAWNTVLSARSTQAFDPASLLIGRIELQGPAYADAAARTGFYNQLVERIAATPGVAAAAASSRDLVDAGVHGNVEIEGRIYPREQDKPSAFLEVVTRDYFRVVDREALQGRAFDARDQADSTRVAMVNQTFAARFWPGEDPIGKRLRADANAAWATVVGVVPDLGMEGVGNPGPGAGWYLLQDQMGWGWLELLVRTEGPTAGLVDAVRAAVAAIDPDQPVHTIMDLGERTRTRTAGTELIASVAGVFAAVAMLLAAIGVYGVIAQHLRARRREFGLRMALGASGTGILRLVLARYAPPIAIGVAAGALAGQALVAPLAQVMPHGAGSYAIHAIVIAALAGAAGIASLLPARRAAATDPMEALRSD